MYLERFNPKQNKYLTIQNIVERVNTTKKYTYLDSTSYLNKKKSFINLYDINAKRIYKVDKILREYIPMELHPQISIQIVDGTINNCNISPIFHSKYCIIKRS